MSDTERGLLDAVIAEPGNDVPRLVYADWLEENAGHLECTRCKDRRAVGWDYINGVGSPPKVYPCPECTAPGYVPVPDGRRERSEFIRVQVEIASLPDGVRKATLRERERELYLNNVDRWFGKPPPHYTLTPANVTEQQNGHTVCVLHRGFVAEASCPLRAWVGQECENCGGFGEFRRRHDNGDGPEGPCPDCGGKWNSGPHCDADDYWDRGTGRVGGCGPLLVGCQPVERVEVSDREPAEAWDGCYTWFKERPGPIDPNDLPAELFDLLVGFVRYCDDDRLSSKTFPNRNAAMSALSAACLAWAKKMSGVS